MTAGTGPTSEDRQRLLADRIEAALAARTGSAAGIRAKRMFGHRAFMVRGALLVTAGSEGLLVRVDPDRIQEVLERPGARPAVLGDRRMGSGWIMVDPRGIEDEDSLVGWLVVALDYNRALTGA